MFQYMFVKRVQSLLPGAVVANVELPEFGISIPDLDVPEDTMVLASAHNVDVLEAVHLLRTGVYSALTLNGYAQRLAYYPDHTDMASLFRTTHSVDTSPITPRSLVINVRSNEVLRDVHQDYGPVPVDYFEQIAQQTGLEPVIVGQLGDDRYSDEIRRRFDGCMIVESVSPIADFELIRSATNLVFGVSTFSWLAAWLSTNTEQVFMPVSGIFNPAQRPDIDLLPVSDERYRFYDFPTEIWSARQGQLNDLVRHGKTYRELAGRELRERRREANAKLDHQRNQTDPSALAAAERQRDRLRRRLRRVELAYEDLRASLDSSTTGRDVSLE